MAGEALPLPPPSVGATIKPRAAVKKNSDLFTFDVDDLGEVSIGIQHKRQRDTGKKDDEGNPVFEVYETSHGFSMTPSPTATGVEDTPANKKILKMITRKHAAKFDGDGKELEPAWEEEVPYTRPTPRRKVVKFANYDIEYEFHDRLLKEIIIVHKKVASVRWNHALNGGKLKKVPGTTDHYVFLTDDGESLNMKITTPTGIDAEGTPIDGLHLLVSAQGQFNLVIPEPDLYTLPLTIDPSFTFDGTDFVIASAQTEVKTHQQLWPLAYGTNLRFLNGYMTADTSGATHDVYHAKTLGSAIDLSAMTDFTVSIKTTGADASWNLWLLIGSDGSNYRQYSKALANDVNATYTLTDFTVSDVGTPDMSNITSVWIRYYAIDTAKAGGVVCQIKDYKFTSPVKTSDMYDSTGRFVIYNEGYEGDDGLAADSYDPTTTVTAAGSSLVEIDDAQAPGSGSTSLLLYRDGANSPQFQKDTLPAMYDYTRFKFHWRAAQTGMTGFLAVQEGVSARMYCDWTGAAFRFWYGNGVGGNNQVSVAYTADTDYEVWMDADLTNDKCRMWIDGVMYPGPNANAGGWDNFGWDATSVSLNRFRIQIQTGTGSYWIDDVKIYMGFEDFSALTAPHDINDITEAVSPSGTDYGRGTWDGDWQGTPTVDNTDVVIGTNSIKKNYTNGNGHLWIFDDNDVDMSSMTHMRMYIKSSGAGNITVFASDADAPTSYLVWPVVAVSAGKWQYFDLEMSAISGGGAMDWSKTKRLYIRNNTGGAVDLWVDGLHFYGDDGSGVYGGTNTFDIDALDFDQDGIPMYDFKGFKDTTGGGSFYSDATVEFTDVAANGIDTVNPVDVTIEGTASSHVKWTAVGDTDPATDWALSPSVGGNVLVFKHVDINYCGGGLVVFAAANCHLEDVDFYVTHGGTALYPYLAGTFIEFDDVSLDGVYATSIYCRANAEMIVTEFEDKATPSSQSLRLRTAAAVIMVNSIFDRTLMTNHAGVLGFMVSKNHMQGNEYVIYDPVSAGTAISEIPTGYRPGPNDDVHIQSGTVIVTLDYTTFYSLASTAGTTIDTTASPHFALLDADVSNILGTWNKSPTTVLAVRKPTRPVPMPLTVPVMGHDYQ